MEVLLVEPRSVAELDGAREADVPEAPDRCLDLVAVLRRGEEPAWVLQQDRAELAGFLERIGPMRWRLMLPYPRSGAKLEVYELTPVAEQPSQ